MKTLLAATVMAALTCAPASAQKLNSDFGALAAKATAKNEVTLEGGALDLLKQTASVAKKDDTDKAGDLGKMLSGIQGVVIRNYEFAKAGEYSEGDLEPLRRQVEGGAGWSRIVNVKENGESTEIYVYTQGGEPAGMLLIAAEAKELTVVHISGSVQLAQLKDLVNSTIQYDLAKLSPAGAKQ
jgi:hypothetical protein